MKLFNAFCFLFFLFSIEAQYEMKYPVSSDTPDWIQLMYQENPNPESVIQAHDLYYSNREMIKNEHTQYYKRWLRSYSRENEFDLKSQSTKQYIQKSKNLSLQKDENSEWSLIKKRSMNI